MGIAYAIMAEIHGDGVVCLLASDGGQILLERLPNNRTRLERTISYGTLCGRLPTGACGPVRSSTTAPMPQHIS